MSVTPNRGLPLMESSQAQPEVVYNAAMEILDMGGGGTSLEVETSGASPGVLDVAKIKFIGATVTEESGGVAVVTVDPSTGGGGSSLELTDGATDLTGVTKITVSGMTVGGTAGAATLTAASGGGGGSSPFNVSPLTHDVGVQPFVATDHFEQTNGTAIDTSGARYTGAAAWTLANQGAATAIQNDGSLVVTADSTVTGMSFAFVPVVGGTWKVRGRVAALAIAGNYAGIAVRNSVSGKIVSFTFYGGASFCVQQWNSPTSFSSNSVAGVGTWLAIGADLPPCYFKIEYNGTNLIFSMSTTGVEGTYNVINTQSTSFLGTPTDCGLAFRATGAGLIAVYDMFEQYA